MRRVICIALLSIFCLVPCGCGRNEIETPTNELPMYGGIPRSAQEKAADDAFIAEMDRLGSRETAIDKMLQFGQEAYRKGDFKTAMMRFNQAWLLDPNNAAVFFNFAIVMDSSGKLDEAIKFYRKSLELRPEEANTMCNLATVLAKKAKGEMENATEASKKEKVRKDYNDALMLYANADQVATNDFDKGMINYQWAIALFVDKNYAEAWKKVKISRKYNAKLIEPAFIKELSNAMPEHEE
jgi:tetratricopeptide (TPR) repeat protein